MSESTLNAQKREAITKSETKALRRGGRVPAIYYFHGEESTPLSIDEKELRAVLKTDSTIIELAFNGKEKSKCVVRDIQWDPVSSKPMHVDFLGIKMTERITMEIPITLVGTASGVKNEGGVMQQLLREIEVEALPADLPEHIEVDVSELAIGDAIHVSDLKIDNVEILNEPEQSIVSISHPTIEEEVEEDEGDELTEPELIGEEKDEEEAEEEQED